MRRRSIRFEQGSNLASGAAGSSGEDARTCPVCALSLPSDASAAEAHVDACLGEGGGAGGEDSSDSEVYEEYTWCNVTRVRATSMLTPEARASEDCVACCLNSLSHAFLYPLNKGHFKS